MADADSPLAQRHLRDGLRKNKYSWIIYTIALTIPAAVLLSFYSSKLGEIRRRFEDPYALPEGFDPNTGESKPPRSGQGSAAATLTGLAPRSLILGDDPGAFSARGRRLAKEGKREEW